MRRYRLLAVCLIASFTSGAGLAKDYPLFLKVYDFSVFNRWDAVQVTTLKIERGSPFYVDPSGGIQPHLSFRAVNQTIHSEWLAKNLEIERANLYLELQKLALKEMLRAGYISRELYDSVIEAADTWEPRQVRYAVLYSELTREQAQALFGENIPWERVSQAGGWQLPTDSDPNWNPDRFGEIEKKWPAGMPLEITRAGAMLGVGQTIDWETGKIESHDLAWQKRIQKIDASLATIDRSVFPLVAEISRAVAFGGVLSGSAIVPITFLMDWYSQLVGRLKQKEERAAVFALSLTADRGRYFNRAFAMDYWTPALQTKLSTSGDEGVREFNARIFHPAAERRALPSLEPTVNVTTLRRFREHVPTHMRLGELSSLAREGSALTNHALSPSQMQSFFQEVTASTFKYFVFPQFPAQRFPVCVWDGSLSIPSARLMAILQNSFPQFSSTHHLDLLDFVSDGLSVNELNAWLPFWRESGMIVPTDANFASVPGRPNFSSIRLSNLTEEGVNAHPDLVRTALLTVYHSYFRDLAKLNEAALAQVYLGSLLARGLPLPESGGHITAYDLDWAFDAFPISIATTSSRVFDEAVGLGGQPSTAMALKKPTMEIDMKVAQEIFKEAIIEQEDKVRRGEPITIPADMLNRAAKIKPLNTEAAYLVHFRSAALKKLEANPVKHTPGKCSRYLESLALFIRNPSFY